MGCNNARASPDMDLLQHMTTFVRIADSASIFAGLRDRSAYPWQWRAGTCADSRTIWASNSCAERRASWR